MASACVLNIQILLKTFPVLAIILAFILGTLIGSFLNVCISRWPQGKSVILPRSRCLACGNHIFWYDNCPLLSYLLLRGRCRACKETIAQRYFWVELFTGILFAVGVWLLPWPISGVFMIFAALMVAGSVVDFETFTLPDPLLVLGVLLGLGISAWVPSLHEQVTALGGLQEALVALCLSTGGLFWFSVIMEYCLKRPAMGIGDSLWIGVIATFIGGWGALFAILGGGFLGTVFIFFAWILEKTTNISLGPRLPAQALESGELEGGTVQKSPLQFGMAVPFGPWLSLAGVLYFLFVGDWVKQWLSTVLFTLALLG